jgi:hypothetical protein
MTDSKQTSRIDVKLMPPAAGLYSAQVVQLNATTTDCMTFEVGASSASISWNSGDDAGASSTGSRSQFIDFLAPRRPFTVHSFAGCLTSRD